MRQRRSLLVLVGSILAIACGGESANVTYLYRVPALKDGGSSEDPDDPSNIAWVCASTPSGS